MAGINHVERSQSHRSDSGSAFEQQSTQNTTQNLETEQGATHYPRENLKDVLKDQWRYWTFIWAIVQISAGYFDINFRARGWLNVVEVEICLSIVSPILVVLFFLLYQKIKEEKTLKPRAPDAPGSNQFQMHLFILSIGLIFIIYLFILVNAVMSRN